MHLAFANLAEKKELLKYEKKDRLVGVKNPDEPKKIIKYEIDIQDSGVVTITSNDQEGAKIARKMISDLTFKPEVGMVIKGKVVRIIPIGAFVELGGGKDGMVHISQICQERIETIEPHVNIGDEVIVKVIKIDDKGRVNLTIKGVTDEDKAKLEA